MRYAEITLRIDIYTLIQCHINTFQYFGGYPQELLYDNIRQIVKKRAPKSSNSTGNPHYQDFFEHYGFIPRLCRPYQPQTKGKIERTVGFVKKDFFIGSKFSSFTDLNLQLREWLSRVNSMPLMVQPMKYRLNVLSMRTSSSSGIFHPTIIAEKVPERSPGTRSSLTWERVGYASCRNPCFRNSEIVKSALPRYVWSVQLKFRFRFALRFLNVVLDGVSSYISDGSKEFAA
jgi:hypothetical protein